MKNVIKTVSSEKLGKSKDQKTKQTKKKTKNKQKTF